MLLTLKILRGVDLLALDENYLTPNASDPYCQIFVNGTKVGWTPMRSKTRHPVWGDHMSCFDIEGGGGTRVTIKIYDYDALSEDDYMGQVSFHAQDFLDRSSSREAYPNIWATVEPPEGFEGHHAGKLQLRIAPQQEKSRVPNPKSHHHTPPLIQLSAGPSLAPKSCPHTQFMFATAPVLLHVYDVGQDARIHAMNQWLTGAGGIFHGAIEIHGQEYSFGYAARPISGIFRGPPRSCPMHTFRESIYLGDCQLRPCQVQAIVRQLRPQWQANTYHLLQKNCCSFSDAFAMELGVGPIPAWVHALADAGAALNDALGLEERRRLDDDNRQTWRSLPVEVDHEDRLANLVLAHVMARRLQRAFWARKAQRMARGEIPIVCTEKTLVRQATRNVYSGRGFEVEESSDDDEVIDFRDDDNDQPLSQPIVLESSSILVDGQQQQQEQQRQVAKEAAEETQSAQQLLKTMKEKMTTKQLKAHLGNLTNLLGLPAKV